MSLSVASVEISSLVRPLSDLEHPVCTCNLLCKLPYVPVVGGIYTVFPHTPFFPFRALFAAVFGSLTCTHMYVMIGGRRYVKN